MRSSRGKYTGEKIKERRTKQSVRQRHINAVCNGEAIEELPEPLIPEVFEGIQETYWRVLKSIPDPRNPGKTVYPIYQILHRVVSGFLGGNKHIGVLFPKKRLNVEPGKKQLGALPTRKAVYQLLRKIDWDEANAIMSPLWKRLGYTPELIVRRAFRNPKEILKEFREEREEADRIQRNYLTAKKEAEERSKGMSAAKAKRSGTKSGKPNPEKKEETKQDGMDEYPLKPVKIRHDLVIDGKVVKASYNSGVGERFVHVTEIKVDANETKSRFIIGTRPTELDRNGEWGAAMSVLDSLTPLPDDRVVLISGDAGFCVEEFCEWLTEKGFFLHLSNKEKCR